MPTLQDFITLLENQKNAHYEKRYKILHDDAINKGFKGYIRIEAESGRKFTRIVEAHNTSSGRSVCYFVENSTGVIYGSASWKQPNFNHEFGTLATIHEWDWSGYYAESLKGLSSLVPKSQRRKAGMTPDEYLQKNGKISGVDFTPENAL